RIWQNLTSLSIFSGPNDHSEPIELQRILRLCYMNLEELSIFGLASNAGEIQTFPLAAGSSSCGQLHFPVLRTLTVSIHAGLSRTWKLDAALIDAPDLRELEMRASPSDLLDAVKAFKASLLHVSFSNYFERDKKIAPELRHELSTLCPTANFVDAKRGC
ncbi:hypothetical protein H0H92_010061, partial [Tricholoma furcatifolium]